MTDICTLDDVLAVITPGTTVTYVDLIERVKAAGRPTWGIGGVLDPFKEPFVKEPHGELRAWLADRFWDDEVRGSWSEAELRIARRPASD